MWIFLNFAERRLDAELFNLIVQHPQTKEKDKIELLCIAINRPNSKLLRWMLKNYNFDTTDPKPMNMVLQKKNMYHLLPILGAHGFKYDLSMIHDRSIIINEEEKKFIDDIISK